MLISWDTLVAKYNVQPSGVLHVGAHLGEEAPLYQGAGVSNVWWVEANPLLIPDLKNALSGFSTHGVVNAAVSDQDGNVATLKVTNNGMSSSLLDLKRHLEVSPDVYQTQELVVDTVTIDCLIHDYGIRGCDFLNMDIQGAELLALKGASKYLETVQWIYSEINTWELYAGCARVWELDEYLAPEFVRVETMMAGPVGWGDALWIRRPR